MAKKTGKTGHLTGKTVAEVVAEEFDEEGLPVIRIDEPEAPRPVPAGKRVRVNAVKTRVPVEGGWRWAYQGEVIDNPVKELLEMAKSDAGRRVFTILK